MRNVGLIFSSTTGQKVIVDDDSALVGAVSINAGSLGGGCITTHPELTFSNIKDGSGVIAGELDGTLVFSGAFWSGYLQFNSGQIIYCTPSSAAPTTPCFLQLTFGPSLS